MQKSISLDKYDWHGCDVVQFDPENQAVAQLFAIAGWMPTASSNYQNGMSIYELHDHYRVDKEAIQSIIHFFELQTLIQWAA